MKAELIDWCVVVSQRAGGKRLCVTGQVQLRNPHGGLKMEWLGAWNDKDVRWTPRMKARLPVWYSFSPWRCIVFAGQTEAAGQGGRHFLDGFGGFGAAVPVSSCALGVRANV